MTAQAETLEFQAEVRQLLQIVIHSLYSEKEIFLRELVSNASDACDKLRVAALTEPELMAGSEELEVRLEVDREARTVTIRDNGIGMTREEVVQNIGTIASSGTRRFLDELQKGETKAEELPRLIGQFGVGFYSSFMVAERVVLETRKAGAEGGVRWTSEGDGAYELEDCERAERGTSVVLHLRALEGEGEGADPGQDFTAEHVLRSIVKRYSDFVEYPIRMEVERWEGEGDEREKKVELATLNSMKPLWTRPKSEVESSEYEEFYKSFTHDWEGPLDTIHFRGEGVHSYTALLFLPKQKPFDLFDPSSHKSRVALYVKRVHILSECEELMPPWLRWVRGLVDSDDLPLNISRETLQHDRQIGQIKKRLTRKVVDSLERMLAQDREAYAEFWNGFGPAIKEGIYHEDELREDVAKVALFHSTNGDAPVTLPEVVGRMAEGQESIHYLAGRDLDTLRSSPLLEAYAAKGREVVLLVDTVDEFAVERLREFDGKPLKSIEQGDSDLESEEEKAQREEREKESGPLLEGVLSELDEYVSKVRFSSRLSEAPAALVSEEGAPSRSQERMMREMGHAVPTSKRVLELNDAHPLVGRLRELHGENESSFGDFCELLHGQALLAEGSALPDPAYFSEVLTRTLLSSGEGESD